MYDVNEIELSTVHQVETSSNNELGVQDDDDGIDEPAPVHQREDGEKSTVAGSLQVLINRREEDVAKNSDSFVGNSLSFLVGC